MERSDRSDRDGKGGAGAEGGDPTRDLVARAQSGDREALNELFGFYWPQVLAAVRRRMGDRLRLYEESIDVVQDTLEQALRSFQSFRWQGEGSFKYWLYTLATNRIRKHANFFAARKRGGGRLPAFLMTGAAGEAPRGPADSRTSSRMAQMNERKLRVNRAMEKLPADKRELLEMREVLGLSHAEIGQALGIEPDAARMRVVRAKEALVRTLLSLKREEA